MVMAMELKDRRRALLQIFRDSVGALKIGGGQLKAAQDRAIVSFEGGTRALIHLATVTSGFAKGEFGAYTSLILYNGPIYRVLRATRLHRGSTFSDDMILRGTSHDLVPTRKS